MKLLFLALIITSTYWTTPLKSSDADKKRIQAFLAGNPLKEIPYSTRFGTTFGEKLLNKKGMSRRPRGPRTIIAANSIFGAHLSASNPHGAIQDK